VLAKPFSAKSLKAVANNRDRACKPSERMGVAECLLVCESVEAVLAMR